MPFPDGKPDTIGPGQDVLGTLELIHSLTDAGAVDRLSDSDRRQLLGLVGALGDAALTPIGLPNPESWQDDASLYKAVIDAGLSGPFGIEQLHSHPSVVNHWTEFRDSFTEVRTETEEYLASLGIQASWQTHPRTSTQRGRNTKYVLEVEGSMLDTLYKLEADDATQAELWVQGDVDIETFDSVAQLFDQVAPIFGEEYTRVNTYRMLHMLLRTVARRTDYGEFQSILQDPTFVQLVDSNISRSRIKGAEDSAFAYIAQEYHTTPA
jgi:hypothetical protein